MYSTYIAGNFRGAKYSWLWLNTALDHEHFTHEWSDFAYLYPLPAVQAAITKIKTTNWLDIAEPIAELRIIILTPENYPLYGTCLVSQATPLHTKKGLATVCIWSGPPPALTEHRDMVNDFTLS